MTTDNMEGGGQPIFKQTSQIKARQEVARRRAVKTTAAAKARAATAVARRSTAKHRKIADQVRSAKSDQQGGSTLKPRAGGGFDARGYSPKTLRQQRDIDSQVKSATGGSTLVGIGRTANPRSPTVLNAAKAKAQADAKAKAQADAKAKAQANAKASAEANAKASAENKDFKAKHASTLKRMLRSTAKATKAFNARAEQSDVNLSPKGPVTTPPPWPKDMSPLEFMFGDGVQISKPLTESERKQWAIGVNTMDKIMSQVRAASGGQTPNYTALREAEKRKTELSKSKRREIESQTRAASGGETPAKPPQPQITLPGDRKIVGLGLSSPRPFSVAGQNSRAKAATPVMVPSATGAKHLGQVKTLAKILPDESTVAVVIRPIRRSAVAASTIGRELSSAGHTPVPVLAVDRKLTSKQVGAVIAGLQKSEVQALAVVLTGNRTSGKVKSTEILVKRLEKAGIAVAGDVAPGDKPDRKKPADVKESTTGDQGKPDQPTNGKAITGEQGEKISPVRKLKPQTALLPPIATTPRKSRRRSTVNLDIPPGKFPQTLQWRQGSEFRQIDLNTGDITTTDEAVGDGVRPGVTPRSTLKVIATQQDPGSVQEFAIGPNRGLIDVENRVTFRRRKARLFT